MPVLNKRQTKIYQWNADKGMSSFYIKIMLTNSSTFIEMIV